MSGINMSAVSDVTTAVKARADDDCDGEIDDVAARDEFPKAGHFVPLFCFRCGPAVECLTAGDGSRQEASRP
jgi:hypothetical protein